MLNEKQIQNAAQQHHTAEKLGVPMQAFSLQYPDMTIEDGYAVQAAWVKLKEAEGRKIIGRKVGLTSRAMQDAMKINEPDFGTLLDDMLFDNGATLAAADFIDPRIEAEITFVLKDDLYGEDLSIEDVLGATDYIVPSLELIAARSHRVDPETGYTRKVMDTISDNAANAGIVVGDIKTNPFDIDMRWVGSILYRNGGIIWLAKRFAPHGIKLEAGHYFMSGSFTRPVKASTGDHFKADFGPLGIVELSFA